MALSLRMVPSRALGGRRAVPHRRITGDVDHGQSALKQARRARHCSVALALVLALQTVLGIIGASTSELGQQSDAETPLVAISSIGGFLFALALPLCAWRGVAKRNRSLLCAYCGCSGVFVVFVRYRRRRSCIYSSAIVGSALPL